MKHYLVEIYEILTELIRVDAEMMFPLATVCITRCQSFRIRSQLFCNEMSRNVFTWKVVGIHYQKDVETQ